MLQNMRRKYTKQSKSILNNTTNLHLLFPNYSNKLRDIDTSTSKEHLLLPVLPL